MRPFLDEQGVLENLITEKRLRNLACLVPSVRLLSACLELSVRFLTDRARLTINTNISLISSVSLMGKDQSKLESKTPEMTIEILVNL